MTKGLARVKMKVEAASLLSADFLWIDTEVPIVGFIFSILSLRGEPFEVLERSNLKGTWSTVHWAGKKATAVM